MPATRLVPCFRRLLALSMFVAAAPAATTFAQSAFSQDGLAGNHPVYSAMPDEHVDPLSGNLIVTATDLVLPGTAGMDLAVTRVYSSQIYPDYENGSSTALEDDNWAGVGWQLHWGRVLHTESTSPGATVVELPGGGGGPLYHTATYSEGWMTKGFARYDRSSNTLKLPNGRIYTFGHLTTSPRGGSMRYVTRIEDHGHHRRLSGHVRVQRCRPAHQRQPRDLLLHADWSPRERHRTVGGGELQL